MNWLVRLEQKREERNRGHAAFQENKIIPIPLHTVSLDPRAHSSNLILPEQSAVCDVRRPIGVVGGSVDEEIGYALRLLEPTTVP